MKLSVIVPIYNVEKYLGECIDSILVQTMTDYEVILVDDGSTDSCGDICDEYAKKHENVYAFHKKNGGLSDARNFGITQAKGEYLIFIDSDDYYDDAEFFQKISDAIDAEPEIVLLNFMRKRYSEVTGKTDTNINDFDVNLLNSFKTSEKIIKHLISNNCLMISACFKVIKRSYVLEKNLFFKKGLKGEDIEWSIRLFSNELNMKFLRSDAYVYRRGREGSITTTIREKNLYDLYSIIETYANDFAVSDNPLKKTLVNYLSYQYTIFCGLIGKIDKKSERKCLIKMASKYKWLLDYNLSLKVKKIGFLTKIFGVKATIYLLQIYIKHRKC